MTIRSLRAAVSFLTVLPVANVDGGPGERLGRAYFPAIGALIGLVAGGTFALLSSLTAPLLAAACAIAVHSILTGAIHLDGLADCADGLLGGGDSARRLEVMRDPRLGSFGVTAIVIVLLLEVAAISSMSPARGLAALVIAGGLGVAVWDARHRLADLVFGSASALLVCAIDWRRAAVALPFVALSAVAVAMLARRRVGGATGDVYGATSELCQLATLLVFAVR